MRTSFVNIVTRNDHDILVNVLETNLIEMHKDNMIIKNSFLDN